MKANNRQEIPELPSLTDGIHLLEADSRTSEALQSLVLDHLLTRGAPAGVVWVDSRGNGSTQPLARLAPSMRVLERIKIARGFTAYQHYSLLEDLSAQIESNTALTVLPDVDWFYRSDDLYSNEGEQMLSEGAAIVEDLSQQHGIPVLLTRSANDGLSQPVRNVADGVIRCELTSQGPRFTGRVSKHSSILTMGSCRPPSPTGTGYYRNDTPWPASRAANRRCPLLGRTNPAYRDVILALEDRWQQYRRALTCSACGGSCRSGCWAG